MRMVLATYTGAGHVLPLVRLRSILIAAGHHVTLLSADETPGGRRYQTVPPPPSGRFEDHLSAYASVLFGPELAREVREVAVEQGAQLVCADALVPAALCGAHASGATSVAVLNLPYGRLRQALRAGEGWWAAHLPQLNHVRRALGLAPYRSALESWERVARMLLLGIPELEDPGAQLPDHLSFVGPCTLLPALPHERLRRPRVVVSLSSSDMAHRAALQAVLTSLGELPVDVVATTARAVDAGTLVAPPNCELHDWLPFPEALVGATAVVTHAGHGTVMAALAAGVPLVAVPLGRDQPFTADQITALGAGIRCTPEAASHGTATVLANDSFRVAALRLRDRIALLEHVAVRVLEGLGNGDLRGS
jgi:UDP:flavonoid glycosyltransferase YjiC (YdhE family)